MPHVFTPAAQLRIVFTLTCASPACHLPPTTKRHASDNLRDTTSHMCSAAAAAVFAPGRIRQWTGDTLGWYSGTSTPVLGSASAGYLFIYSMLTLAFLMLMLFRGWVFQYASLTGSQRLHKHMLHK